MPVPFERLGFAATPTTPAERDYVQAVVRLAELGESWRDLPLRTPAVAGFLRDFYAAWVRCRDYASLLC
jgi:hypothetical protein